MWIKDIIKNEYWNLTKREKINKLRDRILFNKNK